jgi:hypothetical protein
MTAWQKEDSLIRQERVNELTELGLMTSRETSAMKSPELNRFEEMRDAFRRCEPLPDGIE